MTGALVGQGDGGKMCSPGNSQAGFGLYIHVPFCLRRCRYCSFFSCTDLGLQECYLEGIKEQIRMAAALPWARSRQVSTIFFGGGTPTILPVSNLVSLLDRCIGAFSVAASLEISLEANPATIDGAGLRILRQAGFNRLSLGVQSLRDGELRLLGREHTSAEAVQCLEQARGAGFFDINLDCIYGLPGQQLSHWQQTLHHALALEPTNLALYELSLERPAFVRWLRARRLPLPSEEKVLAMMACNREYTARAGMQHYEISNYCLPGRHCRHNLLYWHNRSYLGLGPGAVSSLSGRRFRSTEDIADFARQAGKGQMPWKQEEWLDTEARFRETVVMGLRLIRGISLVELGNRFRLDPRHYYGHRLERLAQAGLIHLQPDRLRLTSQGLLLANQVMAELV